MQNHHKPLVRSLRGQIVDHIRNDVLMGRIAPGQFIRQEDLVARFNVSRTPIREALIQLTNEGLLEAIPNTGVKVRPQPPDHIQEFLTPLRRTIEVQALQLCFDKLTSEDFRLWETMLEKLRAACQAHDFSAMAEHEVAFHRSILVRAEEPTLLKIWSIILSQIMAYFRDSYLTYEDPMDNYREHASIVAMFRTGDKDASLKLYAEMIGAPIRNSRRRNGRAKS